MPQSGADRCCESQLRHSVALLTDGFIAGCVELEESLRHTFRPGARSRHDQAVVQGRKLGLSHHLQSLRALARPRQERHPLFFLPEKLYIAPGGSRELPILIGSDAASFHRTSRRSKSSEFSSTACSSTEASSQAVAAARRRVVDGFASAPFRRPTTSTRSTARSSCHASRPPCSRSCSSGTRDVNGVPLPTTLRPPFIRRASTSPPADAQTLATRSTSRTSTSCSQRSFVSLIPRAFLNQC